MRYLTLILGGLLVSGCVAYEEVSYSAPEHLPMTPGEAISLSEAGYSDGHILSKIEKGGVAAKPDADDVVRMKEAGVSDGVIDAMLKAPVLPVPPPVVERRTVVHRTYYRPSIFLGAFYGRRYCRPYRYRSCRPRSRVVFGVRRCR